MHDVELSVSDMYEEVNHEQSPADKLGVDPVCKILDLILRRKKLRRSGTQRKFSFSYGLIDLVQAI